MTVTILLRFDSSALGLERSLATYSNSAVEGDPSLYCCHEDAVLPYVWVHSTALDQFVDALAGDPAIEDIAVLDRFEDRALCRTRWSASADRKLGSLLDVVVAVGGTVLQVWAQDSDWKLRARFDDQAALDGLRLEDFQVQPDVEEIRESPYDDRSVLTDNQHETLVQAYRNGYFDLPRRTSISEMADGAGISPNATSERLRRATKNLVEQYLSESAESDVHRRGGGQ